MAWRAKRTQCLLPQLQLAAASSPIPLLQWKFWAKNPRVILAELGCNFSPLFQMNHTSIYRKGFLISLSNLKLFWIYFWNWSVTDLGLLKLHVLFLLLLSVNSFSQFFFCFVLIILYYNIFVFFYFFHILQLSLFPFFYFFSFPCFIFFLFLILSFFLIFS